MSLKIITIIGPPGAGKDTQAELLCKRLGCNNAAISKILKEYYPKIEETPTYKKGLLFNDTIVFTAFNKYLKKILGNFELVIITGLPRTLMQAQVLTENYRNNKVYFVGTISLLISKEEAIQRTNSRLVCPICGRTYHPIYKPPLKPGYCDYDNAKLIPRKDDSYKITSQRYEMFMRNYLEIKNFLQKKDALIELNGELPIRKLNKELLKILNRLSKSRM